MFHDLLDMNNFANCINQSFAVTNAGNNPKYNKSRFINFLKQYTEFYK